LDNGGQFVIKKEGRPILVVEALIDGKTYHCGYSVPDRAKANLESVVDAGMRCIAKIRKEKNGTSRRSIE